MENYYLIIIIFILIKFKLPNFKTLSLCHVLQQLWNILVCKFLFKIDTIGSIFLFVLHISKHLSRLLLVISIRNENHTPAKRATVGGFFVLCVILLQIYFSINSEEKYKFLLPFDYLNY